jgi:hypothetical protein
MGLDLSKIGFVTQDHRTVSSLQGYKKYVPESEQELQDIKKSVRYVAMTALYEEAHKVITFSYEDGGYFVDLTTAREEIRSARLSRALEVIRTNLI